MGPAAGASALSIGSLGFDAAGSIVRGMGEKSTQDFLAARDERAAALGRLRAEQTGTFFTEQLNTTLANIDSIRAAANIDPTSPTTAVIKAHETDISNRQRDIAVGNLMAQAGEDQRAAMYRRQVGENALLSGFLGAGAKLTGGLATLLKQQQG